MLQLFRGIYTGLEASADNIDACINEGLETIEMFEQCFHAFKMGKVSTNDCSLSFRYVTFIRIAKNYCRGVVDEWICHRTVDHKVRGSSPITALHC